MSQPSGWPDPGDHQGQPVPYPPTAPPAQYPPATPPAAYGQPPAYAQPPAYDQPPTYGQPPGYTQPPMYGQPPQPGYGPAPTTGFPASPGYPEAGAPPGQPGMIVAPPPPRRHTGLKITLGVLAVLLLFCGIGAVLVAQPVLKEYPATLSAPDTIAGMPKLDDPAFQTLGVELSGQLEDSIDASSTLAAFYAPDGDRTRVVMLAGATKLMFNPGTQLDDAFKGFESTDLTVTDVSPVDAGSMGGSAKCGRGEAAGIGIGVCVWADHGSVGVVFAFNHDPGETADLMRKIRPEVLHRG